MINKWYPNTGSSLADSITLCCRAWKKHDKKGYTDSSNDDPIATFFVTHHFNTLIVGEVESDGTFSCPMLDEELILSDWVPLIFYNNSSIIYVPDPFCYFYLYYRFIAVRGGSSSGILYFTGRKKSIFVDGTDIIHHQHKLSHIVSSNTKFIECQYIYQDRYISYLKDIVYDTKCTGKLYEQNICGNHATRTKSNLALELTSYGGDALELTSYGGDALEKPPISVTSSRKGQIYE